MLNDLYAPHRIQKFVVQIQELFQRKIYCMINRNLASLTIYEQEAVARFSLHNHLLQKFYSPTVFQS
jgi:hypothetical protein